MTLGDPRGIGPEIVARALSDERVRAACTTWVIGPAGTDAAVDEPLGRWTPGGDAAAAGSFAGRAVDRAARLALAGEVDGIVTAPLDKSALLAGGFDYPGHTEMLADIAGPFRIEDPRRGAKFVVVSMLTSVEGGDFTIDDLRERIRDQLSQEKAMRRMLDQLRQTTYVSIRI